LIPLEDSFYSVVTRDVVPHPEWRGFSFHFKPGATRDERIERAARVLGVARADLEQVEERHTVLPAPVVGHAATVAELDRALAGTRVAVTGNWFAGLSNRGLRPAVALRVATARVDVNSSHARDRDHRGAFPRTAVLGQRRLRLWCARRAPRRPAEVTLRQPPPLDTPLELEVEPGRVRLLGATGLIGEALPASVDLEAPPPPSPDEAAAATAAFAYFDQHAFPTCFVCGPERARGDGLRIFPGRVAGRDLAAAPWRIDPSLTRDDEHVRPEIVWAALDCPRSSVSPP
jgi:hypothetical protein